MALKVLYKPGDEFLGIRIHDLLAQEGIESILRSYQMPWYDGIAKMMRPEWGEILVSDQDYERAFEILKDLLATLDSQPQAVGDSAEPEQGPSGEEAHQTAGSSKGTTELNQRPEPSPDCHTRIEA
ncbi:MAG: DUF2007 domain-containing protein [candidate division WOR-3 bacterium]